MNDGYLLDSNIFIQSHRFEYRFSFCSGFWELLQILHQREIVFSIRAVKNELLKNNDALSAWIRQLPESFFCDERGFSEIFERINTVVSDKGATISDVDKLVFTFYFERSLQFMKFLTRFDKFRLQSNEGLLSANELAEYITCVLEVDGLDSGFCRADGAGNSGVNGSK